MMFRTHWFMTQVMASSDWDNPPATMQVASCNMIRRCAASVDKRPTIWKTMRGAHYQLHTSKRDEQTVPTQDRVHLANEGITDFDRAFRDGDTILEVVRKVAKGGLIVDASRARATCCARGTGAEKGLSCLVLDVNQLWVWPACRVGRWGCRILCCAHRS